MVWYFWVISGVYRVANKQHPLYEMSAYSSSNVKITIGFVMREDRSDVQLSAQLIGGLAIEFLMRDDESVI